LKPLRPAILSRATGSLGQVLDGVFRFERSCFPLASYWSTGIYLGFSGQYRYPQNYGYPESEKSKFISVKIIIKRDEYL
jgi:hypothetical protein